MGMSEAARAANPYAEHEEHTAALQEDHDALLDDLAELDKTPLEARDLAWWAERDELATKLRQQAQVLRSAELARTQAEGFAQAMTPATITEDETPQEAPAEPEE